MTNRFFKIKLFLIIFNIILLCTFCILGWFQRHSLFLGMTLSTSEQIQRRTDGHIQLPYTSDLNITFQNTPVPYNASGQTLYFPQDIHQAQWFGLLKAPKGYSLYITADEYLHDKTRSLQENHTFSIYLISKENYVPLQLVFTGTPIIDIHTAYSSEPEEIDYETDPDRFVYESQTNYYGDIHVWDPDTDDTYKITSTNLKYHIKGATTSVFEKKSYSLHLKNDKDESKKYALLGMREDDDWKLNSLVTDPTCLREMTATQLWKEFDASNPDVNEAGAAMRYTEVLIDNDYRGLYCLVEPVDSKKLDLDENDYLYKSMDEELPDYDCILESVENNWRIAQSVRIMYPDTIKDYSTAWYPLVNHYSVFQYYSPKPYQFETAASYIYLSNLCDRTIFNLVTSASDNSFKNTYYAIDIENDSDCSFPAYRVREIPWDLDYTFGNQYDYNADFFTTFDADPTQVYLPPVFRQLLFFSPEPALEALSLRWQECRTTFLSTDSILSLFETNRQYLLESGALLREQDRWIDRNITTDIQKLNVFQRNRMEWLDQYISEGMPQ